MNKQQMINILGPESAALLEHYVDSGSAMATASDFNKGIGQPQEISTDIAKGFVSLVQDISSAEPSNQSGSGSR